MALGRDLFGIAVDSGHVTIGEVADEVRDLLYLPPDARILGSVEVPRAVAVLAATTLDAESIERLYRSELPARGWQPTGPRGSLVAPGRRPTGFCRPGWRLSIGFGDRSDGPNDLRLDFWRNAPEDCEEEPYLAKANLEAAGWRPAPAPTFAHAASWEREDDQGERVVHSIVAAVDPYRPGCQIVTFVTNTR